LASAIWINSSAAGIRSASTILTALLRLTLKLIVRASAFFGPWDQYNFLTLTLRQLAIRMTVRAAQDMTISPTYVPDLVNASLVLLIDGATGLWHLTNQGATTWAEFARHAASMRGYDAELILPVPASSLGLTAPCPEYSALGTERVMV
jgi:dTDP-4-dehydrorhamnose reductase